MKRDKVIIVALGLLLLIALSVLLLIHNPGASSAQVFDSQIHNAEQEEQIEDSDQELQIQGSKENPNREGQIRDSKEKEPSRDSDQEEQIQYVARKVEVPNRNVEYTHKPGDKYVLQEQLQDKERSEILHSIYLPKDENGQQRPELNKKTVEDAKSNRVRPNGCHRELADSEIWSPPNLPSATRDAQQDDPELALHICQDWLLPPFTGARKLRDPERTYYSQRGQDEFIDQLLKQRRNGFFIESGAADGESLSNSIFFEKSRNWTGVLVEANAKSFQSILEKQRHAYMLNACLSPTTKPMVISFRTAGYIGGLVDYMENSHQQLISRKHNESELVSVQCFPLFAVLRAMGVTHVDYFSLDIEGAEVEVLKTLPLDQITVDVFTIEYVVSENRTATQIKLKAIKEHLVTGYGYTVVETGYGGEDVILVRKGIT